MFQRADPEAQMMIDGVVTKIGRLSACQMCEMKDTKPLPGFDAEHIQRALYRVENLVSERDAGFPLDRSRISLLDVEGVILWTRIEKQHERVARQALLTALTGAGKR